MEAIMELNAIPTQLITTAFVFGLAALAFSTAPFLFTLSNGILKARNGNTSSSSIISVFCIAFILHTASCIFFILGIKLLDILNNLYESNYYTNKIFPIFWARGESEVFQLAGASGSLEEKGAYLQLFALQTIVDWIIIIIPILIFITASTYGAIQARKDTMHTDYLSFFIWMGISNIIAFFLFFIWAKIASLALFIPNGSDLISKMFEMYKNLPI
ncbi:hypothetical protein QTF06_001502 [Campylobacter jejuni]|nr:hypothetical protein [Campylobacter jejuni]ELQ2083946.1 hypothetical protein [Campylobacter jejuni]ELQ2098224.1 hypothetical protein [Campylobacter jejuni]